MSLARWFVRLPTRARVRCGRGVIAFTAERLESRRLLSSVGGIVYHDVNQNGRQDPGEWAIPDQHVWLDQNGDGAWEPGEPAATTDATGAYSFDGLADGGYAVRYFAPPGFHQTAPSSAGAGAVTLPGAHDGDVNFGVAAGPDGGSIAGSVFHDRNADAAAGADEPDLAGQHVWIDTNGDGAWEPGEPAAVTDDAGSYRFGGLDDGTYAVDYYVPPGFEQTAPLGLAAQHATVHGTGVIGADFGVVARDAGPLHVTFDFRYDTSGFFAAHPAAVARLYDAATAFASFTDSLAAVTPGGGNSWSETFSDPGPSAQRQVTLANPSVPPDTIVIYVGARADVSSAELGEGGPGGWSATGTEDWLDTVRARGQPGALPTAPTDYAPWGGSISLSSTANWNFSSAGPAPDQADFLTVATHELAHVLGVGTAPAWQALLADGHFTGPHATAANGGVAPSVDGPGAHFSQGTQSTANGAAQDVVMEPVLPVGQRSTFTRLDYAGLADVGWQVPASLD